MFHQANKYTIYLYIVTKIFEIDVPWLAHPKSKFGVSVVNTVDGILASNIEKKISKLFGSKEKDVTKDIIALPRFNHQ
jgi:hypothetical protein